MTTVGRNPNRIMALIQDWSEHHQGSVRFVGEPVWPGRSEAEVREDSEIAITLDELVRERRSPNDRRGASGRGGRVRRVVQRRVDDDRRDWWSATACRKWEAQRKATS